MSTAAAATADAAPAPKSKKMLIIIIAAVVLVLVLGGVGAMLMMKNKPADAEGDDEAIEAKPAKAAVKHDPKAVPLFAPLEPFVVNLADKEAERYAQIGITLEVGDAKIGDQIKTFMPAIRHVVLMVLAEKTAAELIERAGKEKFARQVQREVSRVLGAEVDEEGAEDPGHAATPAGNKEGKGAKKKKKGTPAELPVRAVHFSSFIVQ